MRKYNFILISIIIPNYNKAKYILKTINSLKSQTFQNWECIIIDDFSNDESMDVINKSTFDDNRFVVFKNDKNMGACYSRNQGLNKVKGNFVMFLDSDDILSYNCLSKRRDFFKNYNNFDFLVFPIGSFYDEVGDSKYVWNNFSGNHLQRFLSHDLPWAICSVMWKKSFLIKVGGFNESTVRLQDVDLHTRSLLYDNCNYKTFSNYKPDCYYRVSHDRIKDFYVFARNDINGKIDYIKSFTEKVNNKNIKYLKGTYFECFSLPFNFYFKGYINLLETKKLVNYTLNKIQIKFNPIDNFILKFYIRIRINRIYIKGLSSIFKFFFIR